MLRRRKRLSIYNVVKNVSIVSESAIRRLHNKILETLEKKECLEIGLNAESENCVTVDLGDKADYTGDIRGSFAPHGGYEPVDAIEYLPQDYWKIIQLVHTVEHIEWLYQESMFNWVYTLLRDKGYIYIDTPNLDYILDIYKKNLDLLADGKELDYPYRDHPDFAPDEMLHNFIPWVEYKLYSGCSPGDYHHCMYNAIWLSIMLETSGFKKIKIHAGRTLLALAVKENDDV